MADDVSKGGKRIGFPHGRKVSRRQFREWMQGDSHKPVWSGGTKRPDRKMFGVVAPRIHGWKSVNAKPMTPSERLMHRRISGRNHIKKSIAALGETIEKARYTLKLSPAQRRNAVISRLEAANSAKGLSRTRGGAGRSKLGPSQHIGARGPKQTPGFFTFNGRSQAFANAKRNPGSKSSDWTISNSREKIHEFRTRRGEASPYKRTLGGSLKRIKKAKPKTLYVYRPVENAADIIAWAKSQGFATTLAPQDLHVTLAYSKTPLNWAKLYDDWHLEPEAMNAMCSACAPVCRSEDGGNAKRRIKGGVREVKPLGAEGAVVLAFESDTLTRRWMDFKAAGAVWSFPSFTPHVTISYDGKGVDLDKVHPYAGDIVLGEECWEEVKEAAIARQVTKALDALGTRLGAVEKKLETAA